MFWVKFFDADPGRKKFVIRDGKMSDPGSGNIPDPQHCLEDYLEGRNIVYHGQPSPSYEVTTIPLTSVTLRDYLDEMDMLPCKAQPFFCGDLCPTDQQEAGG
jgi:hypothetical protein